MNVMPISKGEDFNKMTNDRNRSVAIGNSIQTVTKVLNNRLKAMGV